MFFFLFPLNSFLLKLLYSKADIGNGPVKYISLGSRLSPLFILSLSLEDSLPPLFFLSILWHTWQALYYPCCTVFYLFESLCFLPNPTEVSQGLSSISMFTIGPFAAPFLMWFLAELFLSRSLKPKVWYLTYSEIFRKKLRRGKKKDFSQQIYVSRFPLSSWKQF